MVESIFDLEQGLIQALPLQVGLVVVIFSRLQNNGTLLANSSGGAGSSPNYKLNSTDGSATFAGEGVQSSKFLYSVIPTAVSNPANYNAVLVDYLGTQTAGIKADGSATFAGGTAKIQPNGSFTNYVTNATAVSGTDSFHVWNTDASDYMARINGDGSASFASNVGIGTASPGYALDVKTSAETAIRIDSGSSNNAILRFAQDGVNKAFIQYPNGGGLTFGPAGSEAMRLDSSGDALIGGTLPASPNISLNANGSATFAGGVNSSDLFRVYATPENQGCFIVNRNNSNTVVVFAMATAAPRLLVVFNQAMIQIMELALVVNCMEAKELLLLLRPEM